MSSTNLLQLTFKLYLISLFVIQQCSGEGTRVTEGNVQESQHKKSVLGIDLKSLLGFGSKSPSTNFIPSMTDGPPSHQQGFQSTSSLVPFDISVLGNKSPSEQLVGQTEAQSEDEMSDYDFLYNTAPSTAAAAVSNLPPTYSLSHHSQESSPVSHRPVHIPFSVPTTNRSKYNYGQHFMNTNMYPPLRAPKYQASGMNEINVIPWIPQPSWTKTERNVPLRYEERDALSDFLLGKLRGPFSRNSATPNFQRDLDAKAKRRQERMRKERGMVSSNGKDVIIPDAWGQRGSGGEVQVGLNFRGGTKEGGEK